MVKMHEYWLFFLCVESIITCFSLLKEALMCYEYLMCIQCIRASHWPNPDLERVWNNTVRQEEEEEVDVFAACVDKNVLHETAGTFVTLL